MIDVKLEKHCGKFVSFNIEGHAGYAEEGFDIVCSAISVLSGAIVNGITEVLAIKVPYEVNHGFLSINLGSQCEEDIERSQVLFETMYITLKSLLITYGDYISVKVEEV
ncbi:MAG: ribosomal-processing cysteine protease Prp [Clostridiaceae bacterium]